MLALQIGGTVGCVDRGSACLDAGVDLQEEVLTMLVHHELHSARVTIIHLHATRSCISERQYMLRTMETPQRTVLSGDLCDLCICAPQHNTALMRSVRS